MTDTPPQLIDSDFVAERIRQVRRKRGLSAAELADRCAQAGAPQMTASVIANIETGRRGSDGRRRRDVTIDEVLLLAQVLNIGVVHLLVDIDGSPERPYTLTSGMAPVDASTMRSFIRGEAGGVLPGMDKRIYASEVPVYEWQGNRLWSSKVEADLRDEMDRRSSGER